MRRSATIRPIYGRTQRRKPDTSECCTQINLLIERVSQMMLSVIGSVQSFFPASNTVSQFVAEMRGRLYVSPKVYVRLMWRKRHQNVLFDDTNVLHRLQIKGIYLELGASHLDDPLFRDTLGLTLV